MLQNRKVRNRRDFAKGLARIEGTPIPNAWYSAPPLVIAFELEDPTSLERKVIELLWALMNVMSCIEKGEEGAFIEGIPGLKCIKKREDGGLCGGKAIILPVIGERPLAEEGIDEGAEDSLLNTDFWDVAMKEIEIELRIHEAVPIFSDDVAGTEDHSEHFMFLVVKSPLAFSLRHAIYSTLQVKKRGQDGMFADERRMAWNKIATHVRQGLVSSALYNNANAAYSEREMEMAHDLISVNWFQVSNADSFTCLFSTHEALDWVRARFFARHGEAVSMELEGFGNLSKDLFMLSPSIISRYKEYDTDVDKAVAKSNAKKGKKKRGRSDQASVIAVSDAASVAESLTGDSESTAEVNISKPDIFITIHPESGKPVDAFPGCKIAMRVVLTPCIEVNVPLQNFTNFIRVFPASVTMDILKKTLLARSVPSQEIDNHMITEDDEDTLSLFESQQIVCGRNTTLDRPMLSNGDASWARHCMNNVMALKGPDRENMRLGMLQNFLKLGYGLAITRAIGSDMYVNSRVASYSKFISHGGSNASRLECFRVAQDMNCLSGDPIFDAMNLFMEVSEECNQKSWNLKPDNMFMVIQLMVSDMMLALNYHGSMIGGASNGIGTTIVIRDGGGSFRKWFRDPSTSNNANNTSMMTSESGLGQVYSKHNGCGADFGIGVYKSASSINSYYPQFKTSEEVLSDLKRSSELGLLQEVCNMSEYGSGGEKIQTHFVTETMKRMYSTELTAGNDGQSQACMKAITWLIARNTTSTEASIFKSNRLNEKTKVPIPIEYKQVIYGYWVLCSNSVGVMSRERYRTICVVSRSVSSGAGALARNQGRGVQQSRDVPDSSSVACDFLDKEVLDTAKPVFFSGMCTAVVAGFMQWIGVMGKTPASPVTEALCSIFYFHVKFSRFLLNPDMYDESERARCFQISKARCVAKSLFACALQETAESGRRCEGHREAIERCCLRMMTESITPSMVPWLISDTLEHMFRLDFLLLMQMMCHKFGVGSHGTIRLEDVLQWLDSGDDSHCVPLQTFLSRNQANRVRASMNNGARRRGNEELTSVAHCMYISSEASLGCTIPDPNMDVEAMVVGSVATGLFIQFNDVLAQQCQIDEKNGGEEILRAMLTSCVNQQMEWPSVFCKSDDGKIPNFWMGSDPAENSQAKLKNALAPLRIVITEIRKALLCVDCRWLLLVHCISGSSPSQSSRFNAIGHWVRYFYRHNIPNTMIASPSLYIGMPSPYMHGGFILPQIFGDVESGEHFRTLLQRPNIEECVKRNINIPGTNAPIVTGLVEDLGPAAPRYQLAHVLNVNERTLPTDCVSYSLPMNIWLPVLLNTEADAREFASLRVVRSDAQCEDQDVKFELMVPGAASEEDVTAYPLAHLLSEESEDILDLFEKHKESVLAEESKTYMNGRLTRDVRPLCIFFRPGVLGQFDTGCEFHSGLQLGIIKSYDYNRARYRVCFKDYEKECDPYEVEDGAKAPGTTIYLSIGGIPLSAMSDDPISLENCTFYHYAECEDCSQLSQRQHKAGRGPGQRRLLSVTGSDLNAREDFVECKISIPNGPSTIYSMMNQQVLEWNGKATVMIMMRHAVAQAEDGLGGIRHGTGSDAKIFSPRNVDVDIQHLVLDRGSMSSSSQVFLHMSV